MLHNLEGRSQLRTVRHRQQPLLRTDQHTSTRIQHHRLSDIHSTSCITLRTTTPTQIIVRGAETFPSFLSLRRLEHRPVQVESTRRHVGLHVDLHVPLHCSTWPPKNYPYVISPVSWCGQPNLNRLPKILCPIADLYRFEPDRNSKPYLILNPKM